MTSEQPPRRPLARRSTMRAGRTPRQPSDETGLLDVPSILGLNASHRHAVHWDQRLEESRRHPCARRSASAAHSNLAISHRSIRDAIETSRPRSIELSVVPETAARDVKSTKANAAIAAATRVQPGSSS